MNERFEQAPIENNDKTCKLMSCTYTLNQVIELIDKATQQEITALCSVIGEEKSAYSPYHLRVIAAAINIQLDVLQIKA